MLLTTRRAGGVLVFAREKSNAATASISVRTGKKICCLVLKASAMAMAVLGVIPPLRAQSNASPVSFQCSATHAFAGFGLNAFPLGQRTDALASLIQELHVKWLRWPVLPDVEAADIPESSSFNGLVDWLDQATADQQASRIAFFDRMRALELKQVAVSYHAPVKWRVGGKPTSQAKPSARLAQDRIDTYARLLAAQLVLAKRHGVVPDAIELLNEPDDKNSPLDYARLVDSFRGWQQRERLTATRVAGAGTVFTWADLPYLKAVQNRGVGLDIISAHAYDPLKTHRLPGLQPLLRSLPPNRQAPLFVTEYGVDTKVWFPNNPDAMNTPAHGVVAAAETLALLGSGANAVFFWEAQDAPWEKPPFWGLLDKQDKQRLAVAALRTITPSLNVGDRIVSSEARGEALPVMLVKRPSQLLLEIANPSDREWSYDFRLDGCSAAPISITSTAVWPTSRNVRTRLASGPEIQVTLSPQSVSTITLQPH